MRLLELFENQGNYLFRHRGLLPVVLFVLAIPFVFSTKYQINEGIGVSTLACLSIASCVIGFMIRFYTVGTSASGTSGRNRNKQVANSLNTTGPYSMVRHPLYLGNFFLWFGLGIYSFNIFYLCLISLGFWIYYERIMFAEEQFLEKQYGESFVKWSRDRPAFFPSIKQYIASENPFILLKVVRNEYSGMLATVTGFAYLDLLRSVGTPMNELAQLPSFKIVLVTAVLSISIKILKKYTRLLNL